MKTEVGKKNCLYPMPTTLVGVNVAGKVNFITIAHVGIMGMKILSICMSKEHYSNTGIKENKTFSVNIPSTKMVKETDYCGLVSGKNIDKATLFTVFYGKLKTAPMIENCPINMECKLVKTVDFPTHEVFIGEIVETYCDDSVLTKGTVDVSKVDPVLFSMNDRSYWKLGKQYAKAWSIGKKVDNKKSERL